MAGFTEVNPAVCPAGHLGKKVLQMSFYDARMRWMHASLDNFFCQEASSVKVKKSFVTKFTSWRTTFLKQSKLLRYISSPNNRNKDGDEN